MPPALPPPPPVRVVLPDGQELTGRLYERRQFPRGGWMYWVGLAMWADVSETEGVEAQEYRVWLTGDQARPIRDVTYDQVPTHPLQRIPPTAEAADRWAWKVEGDPGRAGRPGSVVVHVWDCPEAPASGDELGLFSALEILQRPGAVACSECGADVALGPLSG